MVLDHIKRVAYTANSNRANPIVLERFCTHFQYEPMAFDAFDETGRAVYHTNVMMAIASQFALIGSQMIAHDGRRQEILHRLESTGRKIIDLSFAQIGAFAGNALELMGNDGRFLAISKTAYNVLTEAQIQSIETVVPIVPLDVSTIELAGGSVRCMLAGIHLSRRVPV